MATETKEKVKAKTKEVAATVGNTALSAAKGLAGIPQPVWVLLAVAGGVWIISKTLKDALADPNDLEFDKGKEEVKGKAAQDGSQQPTITANEAMSIAGLQEAAMANPWDDEDLLKRSLAGLNGKDLQLVYNAFGSRWFDPLTRTPSGPAWPTSISITLFEWYKYKLNDNELNDMRAIWKKGGFNF